MFSISLEMSQILRLKYLLLWEMKLHDFDPNQKTVQPNGAILDCLDRPATTRFS
jgi:hypothetical protein